MVIMEYLVSQGYPDAAAKFAKEANITRWPGETKHLDERCAIRDAIYAGKVQSAIDMINKLDPKVSSLFLSDSFFGLCAMIILEFSCTTHNFIAYQALLLKPTLNTSVLSMSNWPCFCLHVATLNVESCPTNIPRQLLNSDQHLNFALIRLQLLEAIKPFVNASNSERDKIDIIPIINFASQQLAPIAPADPSFMQDLEETMALLIIPKSELPPNIAALLSPQIKEQVASRVNEAILELLGHAKFSRVKHLTDLRLAAEMDARNMVERAMEGRDDAESEGEGPTRASGGGSGGNGGASGGSGASMTGLPQYPARIDFWGTRGSEGAGAADPVGEAEDTAMGGDDTMAT